MSPQVRRESVRHMSSTPGPSQDSSPAQGPELSHLISGFEETLGKLKRSQAEAAESSRKLADRERDLVAREQALTQQVAGFEEARVQLQNQRAELDRARTEVDAARAQAAQRAAEIDRQAAEFKESASRFEDRQQALAQRDAEIVRREAALAKEATDVRAAREAFEAQRSEIEQSKRELKAFVDEVQQHAAEIEAKTRSLEDREKSLRVRETDTASRATDLERQATQARESLTQAQTKLADFDRREAELAKSVASCEAKLAEIAREREQVAASKVAVEKSRAELEARSAEFAAARTEFENKVADFATRDAALGAREALIAERQRVLDDQHNKIGELQKQVELAQSQQASDRRQLESIAADMSRRERDLQAKLTKFEREVKEAQAVADANGSKDTALAASKQRVSQVERELAGLQRKLEEGHEQLRLKDETIANVQAELQKAQNQAAALEGQIAQVKATAGNSSAANKEELDRLRTERDAACERVVELEHAHQEATNRLEEARAQVEGLKKLVDTARRHSAEPGGEHQPVRGGEDAGKLAELENVLEQLKGRLKAERDRGETLKNQVSELERRGNELEVVRGKLESELKAARSGAAGPAIGRTALRMERVKRATRAVKGRASKLRKAESVIAKRYEQCAEILSMRQTVLDAKHAVDVAQRKMQGREAINRSAVAVFMFALATFIMAGLAWVIAGEIAPGKYIAKSVVAADPPKNRTLTDGELQEWWSFIEAQPRSPEFQQFLAERMGKANHEDLNTPAKVITWIQSGVTVTQREPGEAVIEARGQGRTATAERLVTLVTALQTQSRAWREKRLDGATTIVRERPEASSDALDQTRLAFTAMVFLGQAILIGGCGWLVGRKLVREKHRFENPDAVDEVEDPAKWQDPAKAA